MRLQPDSAIDISACPWIATLNVAGNGLSALNVVGRTELRSLFCYENRLTQLDLSGCEWLDLVNCGTNRLTELNVTGCSRLSDLYCYDNRLERLDLKPLIAILGGLYCPGNRLTELDLKDFRQLTHLDCSDNALQRIDLTAVRPCRSSLAPGTNFRHSTSPRAKCSPSWTAHRTG